MATVLPGVGIYVRKSTDRQELSLAAQERLIRSFLERSGVELPVVEVYRDILSGKRPDRAGYQQMLVDARLGKLKMVAFHKVNRFGRNTAEGIAAIEELRRLGVIVKIVDMPSLDIHSAEGMFVFTLMLGQGQYEVENLASEARKGMEQKVVEGGWAWRAPDGYVNRRVELSSRKFHSWVEVDRKRAAIVRLIFTWYAAGTTLRSIVRRLDVLHEQRMAAGKTPCLRRSGKPWDVQAVYKVLTNRFYLGDVVVPSWEFAHTGKHAALIRAEQFDQVQTLLRRQGTTKRSRHVYLLQDLLELATEPPMMLRATTAHKRSYTYQYYYYYRDGQRFYFAAPDIEADVVARLHERIATLGDNPVQALYEQIERVVIDLEARAKARAAQAQRERQRVLHLASRNLFTEQEIQTELERLEHDAQWARADMVRAQMIAASHQSVLEEAEGALSVTLHWSEHDVAAQYAAVRQFLSKVTLSVSGQVEQLHWQPLWDTLWFGVR